MKKTIKLQAMLRIAGIIAFVAVVGFSIAALSLTGCDNGTTSGDSNAPATYTGTAGGTTYTLKISKPTSNPVTPPGGPTNPFLGTWNGWDKDGDDLTIIFTATGWSWFWVDTPSDIVSGIYTYNGNTATLLYDDIELATATISGSTLTVTSQYPDDLYTPWILPRSVSRSVLYAYTARALTPAVGDDYELTVGTKKSTGAVQAITGNKLELKPKYAGAAAFDATTSGRNGLTDVTGLITFDDGDEVWGPGELTPVTTQPPSGGNFKWTSVNSTFGTTSIQALAFGNNKFVAGGNSGKMATSTDGVTWVALADTTFGTNIINCIAYGNNKFVAGSNRGQIAYSPDGITWEAVANSTFGTSGIRVIAYGNGKFVAGGSNGKMATSTDGITWEAVANSTFGTDSIEDIAYGNGKFVAGGSNGNGKMAYSSDGAVWTPITLPANTKFYEGIAYGNSKFVAGADSTEQGSSFQIIYSSDGITWTTVSVSYRSWIGEIVFGNNRFVFANSQSITSTDGVTWTTGGEIGELTFAMAYGNGKFVAGGNNGKIAYSSGL